MDHRNDYPVHRGRDHTPRRADMPRTYGRKLPSSYNDSYESDSGALSSGTGRHIPHTSSSRRRSELEEPLTSYFDTDGFYEDDTVSEEPDTSQQEEDYFSAPDEPAFNPNKARRFYQEFEPLDDDLVTYDEFGRKRKKKRIHEEKLMTRSRAVWGWIISIIIAVAVAFIIRAFFFEIIVVDGNSMYPTLYSDEKLAVEKVSRYFGLPERGDIIIVHYPDEYEDEDTKDATYVKRVIALPGETVEVRDSVVYINGTALSEPYINTTDPYLDMAAVTVPEDTVFVMGDNRAHSKDSRTVGPIARSEIVGHALSVIWPLDNIHSVQ